MVTFDLPAFFNWFKSSYGAGKKVIVIVRNRRIPLLNAGLKILDSSSPFFVSFLFIWNMFSAGLHKYNIAFNLMKG